MAEWLAQAVSRHENIALRCLGTGIDYSGLLDYVTVIRGAFGETNEDKQKCDQICNKF